MAVVKLQFELDVNNPVEKVALTELKKWKELLKNGQKEACLKKQKDTFMAGLYLQIAMPELTEKLAHGLLSTEIEDFNHFYHRCYGALKHHDQQSEMLQRLETLQQVLSEKLPVQTVPAQKAMPEIKVKQRADSISLDTEAKVNISTDGEDTALSDNLKKLGKIKAKKIF